METEKLMESEKLPADMMFEILSRASFETVERSKAVSKGLRRMIYDPSFLPLHCKRTNSVFGYYFESVFISDDDHGGAASISLRLPPRMLVLASCSHGILCCMKYRDFYVGKPATQQWQTLPRPKYSFVNSVAFSLIVVESQPLRYIIVQYLFECYENRKFGYNFDIFDSEKWEWEQTQGPTLASNERIVDVRVPISVGKFVHYVTSKDNVVEFNVKKRVFRCFPLPEHVCNNARYTQKQLVNYEGGLGFSCVTKNWKWMDVWVAEGQGWTRKMSVDMKLLRERLPDPELVEFCSTDVAFMKTARGGAFCNFRDGSISEIDVPYHIRRDVLYIYRFQSDFEPVDLKGNSVSDLEIVDPKENREGNWFSWIRNFFCF